MFSPTLTLLCCLAVSGSEGDPPEATSGGDPPNRAEASSRAAADTVPAVRLRFLGSVREDRVRLAQLLGSSTPRGYLIRSPSTLPTEYGPALTAGSGTAVSIVPPELHTVWNSHIPFSMNEGPMWAGRGVSHRLSLGARFGFWRATLIAVPQLVYEQNLDFQTVHFSETGGVRVRHPFASPFHYPPGSMDLPQRFGEESRTFLSPGQSSLTIETGPVAFGAATENLWWGPGIRNGLLMSSHAPGIPHVFLRTGAPLETRIGDVEGRWMLGRLGDSGYFHFEADGGYRSLNALALVLSPWFEPNLSVGLSRAVYAPSGGAVVPATAALDVFRGVGRPFQEPGDTLLTPGREQLTALFARWVFPGVGFEVYGEWGRQEFPKNLRDFLEVPQHSRGYTVGLQFARPTPRVPAIFRLQGEITNLEPSTSFRVREVAEWYTSRRVPEGFTHEGRVIGAAIGPSGSSQWGAADLFWESWQVGLFAGRIRWENEALYSYRPEFRRADVSLLAGIRGGGEVGPFDVSAEYTSTGRLNYLFWAQPDDVPEDHRGVDVPNHTLKLTLSVRSLLR